MKIKEILPLYLKAVYLSLIISYLTALIYVLYPLNYFSFNFLIWYENKLARINNLINKRL